MESFQIITAFYYFIFGTIIGSFLNVVIFRYNTGHLILGKSECLSCGKKLKWFELIPVFSFIFQRGRCRKCKSRISLQYPFIELFTGIVFLGIFLKFSDLLFNSPKQMILVSVYYMVIFSILIVVFMYDIRHKIIPDDLVYTFATISLGSIFFNLSDFSLSIPTLLPIFSGPMLFLPFFLLWYFSKGKWIGLGDGKLALGIGWFTGLYMGINVLMLSFWIGAVVSALLILVSALFSKGKQLTMKSEIPLGPFLILGIFLVFFFEIDIIGFIL